MHTPFEVCAWKREAIGPVVFLLACVWICSQISSWIFLSVWSLLTLTVLKIPEMCLRSEVREQIGWYQLSYCMIFFQGEEAYVSSWSQTDLQPCIKLRHNRDQTQDKNNLWLKKWSIIWAQFQLIRRDKVLISRRRKKKLLLTVVLRAKLFQVFQNNIYTQI